MPSPKGPRQHVKFDAKPDAPKDGPRKPEFKLSEPTRKRGSALSVVAGLVVALALGGYVAMSWTEKPDRHFVAARKLVDVYEAGRAPTARNYNNTIYDEALDELAQVDPESISAEPAAELEREIAHGREAFLARRKETTDDKRAAIDRRQERIQRNHEAHRAARVNRQVEYPECDDEEKGKKHGH